MISFKSAKYDIHKANLIMTFYCFYLLQHVISRYFKADVAATFLSGHFKSLEYNEIVLRP